MIAVIVPFARPQMASNVLANFERQQLPERAELVIVENGPAVGSWRGPGHVVQSDQHRAAARTAGLHAARELGCEWFAFWDDDDWYATGFLEFMWQRRELADVIGLCQHVVQTHEGKRGLVRMREPGPVSPGSMGLACGIASPALFGRVDKALDWTALDWPFGEEVHWYTAMYEAGRTLVGVAEPNPAEPLFVLTRYPDPGHGHATPHWQTEQEQRWLEAIPGPA